eukprot:g17486.t1
MRAVVQRVARAQVAVDGQVVAQIGQGLMVLVGISREAKQEDVEFMTRKLLNLRLWPKVSGNDKEQAWALNVQQIQGQVLLVSQFTLHAVLNGNKPDFHCSMKGSASGPLFDTLVQQIKQQYAADKVSTGVFGAYMNLSLENDGPVTITLDSDRGSRSGVESDLSTAAAPLASASSQTAAAAALTDRADQAQAQIRKLQARIAALERQIATER